MSQQRAEIETVKLELPIGLIGWQKAVFYAIYQFIVVVAGRRSGKTLLALARLAVRGAVKPKSFNWYVAPTYTMAKSIGWSTLKWLLEDFRRHGLIRRIHESDLLIEYGDGSIIQLKGADNPDSLRGVGLDEVILDEYASMKREVWEEVLRPAVTDRGGRALFIGTPAGYNHFYELAQNELRFPERWKTYRFSTIDNPYIPREEIEAARRDMDPRAFRQEYEASFETFGGQVFTDFSRDKHVKALKFRPDLPYELGMDFGWANPTAALFIQTDAEDNVFIFDELKAVGRPIADIMADVRARDYRQIQAIDTIKTIKGFDFWDQRRLEKSDPDAIYCDPAGASRSETLGLSTVDELRRLGFHVKYKPNYPGVIQDRVNLIRKWLRAVKLFIDPKCSNLIHAFDLYRYPEPSGSGQSSEIPLKDGIADHWIDGLGYYFINRFPVKKSTVGVL